MIIRLFFYSDDSISFEEIHINREKSLVCLEQKVAETDSELSSNQISCILQMLLDVKGTWRQ